MISKDQILEFITDELLDDDEVQISFDTSLFKANILDSLNLLSLIHFLESTCSFKIATSEVNFENLDSIDNMYNFLTKKIE